MAKPSTPKSGSTSKFRMVVIDAELQEGEISQLAQAIQGAFGGVPDFISMYPKAGVAGFWAIQRDLIGGQTSLDAKTKALISLAVAAQIPCMYCIYSDTQDALHAGATEEQVHEAVAIAGMTRNASTVLNGYMIDFDTFKKELGYE